MREPVVSRTFKGLNVTALIVDTEKKTQFELTLFIERVPEGKKQSQYLQGRFESVLDPNNHFVTVLSSTPAIKRIAMTEQEFIAAGHEVPLLNTNTENNEEVQE